MVNEEKDIQKESTVSTKKETSSVEDTKKTQQKKEQTVKKDAVQEKQVTEEKKNGNETSTKKKEDRGTVDKKKQNNEQRRHQKRLSSQSGNKGNQQQRRDHHRKPHQRSSRLYDRSKDPRPLEELAFFELGNYARRLGITGAALMDKKTLLEKVKYVESHPNLEIEVTGILERLPDGFGFLRSPHYDYVSGPDDVYVSPSQIRYCGLRTDDWVTGIIRKPRDAERYFALYKVTKVDGKTPQEVRDRVYFDRLTPKHPDKRLSLEYDKECIATRIMDIFTPVGKGQRGLIVAPPKVGKTVLLKDIAKALIADNKDLYLMILLIDERPEEVADMKRMVTGPNVEVVSSTFDEAAERHVQVADIVIERAKRMVEFGKDVVVLLDSITRLARAYNTVAPASGKILTGGIDANALQKPKRFFGAARATEEAGSLTILATALVDTGSRMDEVIYEEFKGTGNMEMHMTRKLANRRIFPALDLLVSGTRRDDLLQKPEDLNKVWVLQKFLGTMSTQEGMEFLIDKLKKFKTNREFLDSINKRESNGNGKKDS